MKNIDIYGLLWLLVHPATAAKRNQMIPMSATNPGGRISGVIAKEWNRIPGDQISMSIPADG